MGETKSVGSQDRSLPSGRLSKLSCQAIVVLTETLRVQDQEIERLRAELEAMAQVKLDSQAAENERLRRREPEREEAAAMRAGFEIAVFGARVDRSNQFWPDDDRAIDWTNARRLLEERLKEFAP